jgi:hypothetical protein
MVVPCPVNSSPFFEHFLEEAESLSSFLYLSFREGKEF